ncbi:MAG: class I SAM-dependent methyltransferase [Candidatus Sumerlaeia bacterium]|nr:class I SAM-dependent methyltransferase [Candidatus Sumerlaeia bacterium]
MEKFLADTDWQAEERREGVLVEIGCGAGRMTRHFAEMFSSIIALDISEKMIDLARQYNPDLPHVEFRAGNGVDLHPLPDSSADFVISYIVFQHIPLPEVIHGYISEGLRVLKPGGRFRFQARNDHQHMKTNTYAGASMDLDIVEQLARDHGCNVHQITGRGEHYCFVELRRPKASQSV